MLSRLWMLGALTVAAILIGCSESSTATPRPTATSTQLTATPTQPAATPTATDEASSGGGADVQANIQNFAHQELTVEVGNTIVWTQQDGASHTTTSGTPGNLDGVWDSEFLNNSQTFSFTFTEAGAFPYYCTIHPTMRATVTVAEAGSADTTSPPAEATATSSGDSSGGGDIEY